MDHLEDEYGKVERINVDCLTNPKHYEPQGATVAHFHQFPETMKWTLDVKNGTLKKGQGAVIERDRLLQTWLFFGLAFTIVQKDGKSLLSFEDLLYKDPGYISTEQLPKKLQEWADWEISDARRNPNGTRMRLIRTALVLEKARMVVRRYCDKNEERIEREKITSLQEDDSVNEELALSLMLLGEALSHVKSNIVKRIARNMPGVAPSGWHNDEGSGWGQPKYVVTHMGRGGWCPRNIHLLRRQLGSQATLLLKAYFAHQKTAQNHRGRHDNCIPERCNVISDVEEDGKKVYITAHHYECEEKHNKAKCEEKEALGPLMSDVERILDLQGDDVFPLLKFQIDRHDNITALKVIEGNQDMEYATISHVWSDGYGNKKANKLWRCQLEYIKLLLSKLNSSDNWKIPFWMDTLVIPVGDETLELKRRKKKAIRQINSVFRHSHYSIVLDKDLVNMSSGTKKEPCQTAVKIIASGWMRRLWTLQEAYLSHKLMIAFGNKSTPLCDLDDLRKDIKKQAQNVSSISASLIHDEISHSIMWHRPVRIATESESEEDKDPESKKRRARKKAKIIASSWRAARWRTTSNKAHETAALATLLGLTPSDQDSGDPATIAEAGISEKEELSSDAMEELMKEFWITVDSENQGSIPAGIIFLRGKRLTQSGFGWAPWTFMTPDEIDYPDPLSTLAQPTILKRDLGGNFLGLVVECPGFLLHVDNTQESRQLVVSTESAFEFPVDSSFIEWYKVDAFREPNELKFFYAKAVIERQNQLALILSRPAPREEPAEVGLLVEIYDPNEDIERTNDLLYVQILFRVQVRRISRSIEAGVSNHFANNSVIFGEAIGPHQKWCVDGYNMKRLGRENEEVDSSEVPEEASEDPPDVKSPFNKLFRVITGNFS